MAGFPGSYFIAALPFNQSCNRACLDTLPAENTVRTLKVVIAHGDDLGLGPPETVGYGVIYLDGVAGLYTAAAKDAPGEVPDNQRTCHLHGIVGLCPYKTGGIYLIFVCVGLQVTGTMGRAQVCSLVIVLHLLLEGGPVLGPVGSDGAVMIS